ncbi:PREDICTED: uncharacterized protein LOC106126627 [Papilio xuthus]|uniref:Uncharacterized protein LOC106126627 n=1 Tax=Papilio xuthus TaxID=66420 RepID=A0AAJ7EJL3_PAPXU|nr:PREDICTED: uncharacterized protein LOC106126627 [Papilio xuthus]
MNRFVLVFAVFTVSVAYLKLAESSGDLDLHKVEVPDEIDEDREDVDKVASAQGNAKAMNNFNMGRPHPQVSVQQNTRPAQIVIDVVECFVCTDCPKLYENTTTKLCPHTLDVTREKRCVMYAERYKHMKRSWYIRGCASERGSCEDIRKAHEGHGDIVQLLHCHECFGNKCNTNSGFRSISDITLALFTIIVSPIAVKYTVS